MFRKKVKEDPTELELLKIRVRNLEKQITEMKKAPQVQAEELGSVVIKTNDSITSKVGNSVVTTRADGFIVRLPL